MKLIKWLIVLVALPCSISVGASGNPPIESSFCQVEVEFRIAGKFYLDKEMSSVVYLWPGYEESGPASSVVQGSGYFISPDGLLVTNRHVVGWKNRLKKICNRLNKTFPKVFAERLDIKYRITDSRKQVFWGDYRLVAEPDENLCAPEPMATPYYNPEDPVMLIDTDLANDMVLLRVKTKPESYLRIGDSSQLNVDEEVTVIVMTILGKIEFVPGQITRLNHLLGIDPLPQAEIITMQTSLFLGSSGSPVLNDKDEVIGTVSMIDKKRDATYFVPIEKIKEMVKYYYQSKFQREVETVNKRRK